VGGLGVNTWLQTQLSSPQLAEFDAGQWNIDVQQNSKTAAPIIHFADGTTFGLDGLFAADLADGKESFTPKDHARYYVDEAVVPQPPPPSILAVAFTDQNGNHTYEAGTDLLIASLLDTNNDGIVSAGDTIHWAHTQHPLAERLAVHSRVLTSQLQASIRLLVSMSSWKRA